MSADAETFLTGTRVIHRKRPAWGVGKVVSQDTEYILVDFGEAGVKKLAAKLALLEAAREDTPKRQTKDEALARIADLPGFHPRRPELEAGLRPSVRIRATRRPDRGVGLGASRFGGRPDLPREMTWPRSLVRGEPLSFLAQIQLEEIGPFELGGLPTDGWLVFFYDSGAQPWGYDPLDRGGWKVEWIGPEQSLERRDPPKGGKTYRSAALSFEHGWDLSPPPNEAPPPHQSEEELDAWFRLRGERTSERDALEQALHGKRPWHHVLGHPNPIQGDMATQCELVRLGYDTGGGPIPDAPLELDGSAWRLLLQLDTDSSPGWKWGDSGRLYFWIRDEDLEQRAFNKVWCILQCD